ncbi:hypothetical protein BH20ACI3_BH20ACI3_03810 [soil metagenome]
MLGTGFGRRGSVQQSVKEHRGMQRAVRASGILRNNSRAGVSAFFIQTLSDAAMLGVEHKQGAPRVARELFSSA